MMEDTAKSSWMVCCPSEEAGTSIVTSSVSLSNGSSFTTVTYIRTRSIVNKFLHADDITTLAISEESLAQNRWL